MDRPIYEDDLTTIHTQHATPLIRLRDRAATSLVQLNTATDEDMLQSALADLEIVSSNIGAMFYEGEIHEPDIPFGEVRMAWIGDIKLGDRMRSCCLSGYGDNDGSRSVASDRSDDYNGYDMPDIEIDDSPPTAEPDHDVDSLSLLELASKCFTTTFDDLRHLYGLYYTIHIHRIDRLLLRLPASRSTAVPPHRPKPIRNPPPPPPGAVIKTCGPQQSDRNEKEVEEEREPGAPLTEEQELQYAHVLADEIGCVAEYKQAIVSVLVREIAGAVGLS